MGLIQKVFLELDQASRSKFKQDVEGAGSDTSGAFDKAFSFIKTGLGGIAAGIGAAFTVRAVVDLTKQLYELGANAGETASKFQTTFGAASAAASRFLADFANKAGLSTERGQDFIATIGAMVQGMGAGQKASEPLAEGILKLAGDLTSFHNVPIEETFAALRSGLVGEFEPLRRFGIVLTAADVQQKALLMTHKAQVSQLTALDKAQAALTLAWERAGPAVGDLDRTQNSAVNTLRRASAEWVDIKTNIGSALVEIVNSSGALDSLGGILSSVADYVRENKDEWIRFGSDAIHVASGFFGELFRILGDGLSTLDDFWEKSKAANDAVEQLGFGTHTFGIHLADAQNVLANTGREFTNIRIRGAQFGEVLNRLAFALGAAFAETGKAILGVIAGMDDALARFTSHIPGMGGVSAALTAEASRARAQIANLSAFQEKQTAAINASSSRSKSLGLELQQSNREVSQAMETDSVGAQENIAAASTSSADKQKANASDLAAFNSKAAVASRKSWADGYEGMVRDAKWATDQISGFLDQTAKAQQITQDKADAARIKGYTDTLKQQTAAQAQAEIDRIQMEMRYYQDILNNANATEAERRDAFQQTAKLEEQLAAARVTLSQSTTREYMKTEEYAQGQVREAIAKSGEVVAETDAGIVKDTGATAVRTRDLWRGALDAISGMAVGLGGVFGGVFGKVASLAAQASSAIGNIGGAIDGLKGPMGGFVGFLGKLPGMLGAIGSAIGLITTVGKIVGGIFHGSKDPGRFSSDTEAYKTGMSGDAQARADASEYFKERAFVALGGGGQWATSIAQRDASEKWISTLRARVIRDHDAGALAELRAVYSRLATAGFTEYKAWADAERRAIPQGIPGFQKGGYMRRDGLAYLHAQERVFSTEEMRLLQNILAGVGGVSAMQPGQVSDSRQWAVTLNLYGIADQDVPRRTVEALKMEFGKGYQTATALQGNTLLPQ